MRKLLILILAFASLIALPALGKPIEMTQKALAKANALGQLAAESSKAATLVDTASRLGIIVEGSGGPGSRGTLVIMPEDPEWAAVVGAVKAVAARRQKKADTDLDALNIKVVPDEEPSAKPSEAESDKQEARPSKPTPPGGQPSE